MSFFRCDHDDKPSPDPDISPCLAYAAARLRNAYSPTPHALRKAAYETLRQLETERRPEIIPLLTAVVVEWQAAAGSVRLMFTFNGVQLTTLNGATLLWHIAPSHRVDLVREALGDLFGEATP